MTTTDKVSQKLQDKAVKTEEKALVKKDFNSLPTDKKVEVYMQKNKEKIINALPKHLTADRFSRMVLNSFITTPELINCSFDSMMAAVMNSAQLGLEPGPLGHVYLIPFGKKVTFIIGYKGMLELTKRAGDISSIIVQEVYQNDIFKFKRELEKDLFEHTPWDMREDLTFDKPGLLLRVYMLVRFKDGTYNFFWLSKQAIDEHRARSKCSNSGPWVTDYLEMAKKTVVRAYWKWMPQSIEDVNRASMMDETTKMDVSKDMAEVPDVPEDFQPTEDTVVIDHVTGEVLTNDFKLQG